MDGFTHLLRRMSGSGNRIESKQVRILRSGESTETTSDRGHVLVAHHRAIQPGGSSVGEDVADCVVNGVIIVSVIRTMVALDVEGLRRIMQYDLPLGILRRLGSHVLFRLGARGNAAEVFL